MESRTTTITHAPRRILASAVLSLLVCIGLSGCGGGVGTSDSSTPSSGTSNPPPPPGPGPSPAPTLSFSASPTTVAANGSTTLTWSSSNASSCNASGGWSGAKALSGSQSINALTSSATYSLSCSGTGGTVTRSVSVTVSASFVVDTNWAANSDNPDGYLVYVGPASSNVTTLVRTLAKGASDWSPAAPSAQLASSDVATALGTSSQVCVAIRAFNGGGVSLPSPVSCAALP